MVTISYTFALILFVIKTLFIAKLVMQSILMAHQQWMLFVQVQLPNARHKKEEIKWANFISQNQKIRGGNGGIGFIEYTKIGKRNEVQFSRKKYAKVLYSLHSKQGFSIKGEEAAQIIEELKKDKFEFQNKQKQLAEQYKKCIDQVRDTLIIIQKEAFQKLFLRQSFLNSKIVSPSEIQSLQFIEKTLIHPKRLELVYRASEHRFSASQFHKSCNGIGNTLTLVQTKFGNINGAFAAPKQSSHFHYAGFLLDLDLRSFLLSLDLKTKLPLFEPHYAIYCLKDLGPSFGRGIDPKLRDRCNQANGSYIKLYPQLWSKKNIETTKIKVNFQNLWKC